MKSSVSIEYHCTLGHKTIMGSVLITRISNTSGITPVLRARDQDIKKLCQFVKAWVKPGPINNTIDIENQVSGLVEELQDVVKAVGLKLTKSCRRTALWWNAGCRMQNLELRRSRNLLEEVAQARNRFRAAVKEAKREN